MRSVLVVVMLAAATSCGGSPRPAPAPPVPRAPLKPEPGVTAEAFCEHLARLTRTCERLSNTEVDPATCVADARAGLAQDSRFTAIAGCVVRHDECDAVLACVTASGTADPTEELRACDDDTALSAEHAVGIPKADWDRRNGAGVTTFHGARSAKAAPIEMCGVPAATHWLTTLRCDDGEQPIKNIEDAEHARPGNVGPGGRCHSIIDRYVIPCAEQRYEIFIDAYVCPRPE